MSQEDLSRAFCDAPPIARHRLRVILEAVARDHEDSPPNEDELDALARETDTVDARALLAAIDAAAGHAPERYSRKRQR